MIKNRTACVVAMTVALGFFAACEDSKTSGPETVAATDSAVPATDPPTTPAPTTVAPTTLAPTTVPPPPPAFLRGDGLTTFDFGAPAADVLAGIGLVVFSDVSYTFPDPAGELYFSYNSGREVCWNDGGAGTLCGFFGGADAATLGLVGWDYGAAFGTGLGQLLSAEGVTINVLTSAVPAIPAVEGACYTTAEVLLNDMWLYLKTASPDGFGSFAEGGGYIPAVPQPADAYVQFMSAGQGIYGEGADC